MLALTRRAGETIRVGDDIYVTVLEIRGKQVRLGVTAPKDVVVTRSNADGTYGTQNG